MFRTGRASRCGDAYIGRTGWRISGRMPEHSHAAGRRREVRQTVFLDVIQGHQLPNI